LDIVTINLDLALFLLSILALISILLYNPVRYYGIPALLVFMGVGRALGNGGIDRFTYDYPEFTNIISTLALNMIIFTAGFHTSIKRIKPVLVEGYAIENALS
jgi:cell volume regulation protein A